MSADNYLAIIKVKNKYLAYDLSASHDYSKEEIEKLKPVFKANSLKKAIKKAEEYCSKEIVEYGIRFLGI